MEEQSDRLEQNQRERAMLSRSREEKASKGRDWSALSESERDKDEH